MIPCKYYKGNHHLQKYFSVIALWADIFIAYIALNSMPTFLSLIYLGDLASFAGSTIIFFFIAGLINRWFAQIVTLSLWTWLLLLLRYFFINNRTYWCLLSSSSPLPQLFWPYFAVTNLWVSRLLRHLRFFGKLFSGVFAKFLCNTMSNTVKRITIKVR